MDAFPAPGLRLASWGGRSAALGARAAEAAILPVAIGFLWYATVGQGGFYRAQGSVLAAGLLALGLASARSAAGIGPLLAATVLLGSGLAAAGLSIGWGPNTHQAAAAFVAGPAALVVARHAVASGQRARLVDALAWLGAGPALLGIAGVAFHVAPWAIRGQGLWRNSSTLTYANAAGCLFVLALGASVLSLAERPSAARRVAAFLTLCGLATTLSRGAAIGAVAGVAVLAGARALRSLRALARPAAGALVGFAALVPSIVGAARPMLGLAGLAAGAAIAVRAPARPHAGRRAFVAVVAVALAGTVAATSGSGRLLEKRALPASETRLRTWDNTLSLALEKPALGYGPGTFATVEEDPRTGAPVLIRYVHNEYLQAFYETGAVGLASVIGALALLAAWAWRTRRRGDAHWAVAVAACAAFAAHSAFDFLWRLPVLVAVAFVWLALAVTPAGEEEP